MTRGRTQYTLTNARCNKTLPGFKELPPKDFAHVGQDTKTTYLGSGLLTGFDEVWGDDDQLSKRSTMSTTTLLPPAAGPPFFHTHAVASCVPPLEHAIAFRMRPSAWSVCLSWPELLASPPPCIWPGSACSHWQTLILFEVVLSIDVRAMCVDAWPIPHVLVASATISGSYPVHFHALANKCLTTWIKIATETISVSNRCSSMTVTYQTNSWQQLRFCLRIYWSCVDLCHNKLKLEQSHELYQQWSPRITSVGCHSYKHFG